MNNNNEKLEEIKKIQDLVAKIKQIGCFIVMQKDLDKNVEAGEYLCPEIGRLELENVKGHHICSTYFITNKNGKPIVELFLSSPTGVILDENDIKITAGSSTDLYCQSACDTEIKTGKLDKKLERSESVKNFETKNYVDKNDEFIYSNYDKKFHRNLIYFCKKNGKETNEQIMKEMHSIFKESYSNEKLEHNEFEILPKDENKKKISIKSAFINITEDPNYQIKYKTDLDRVNISKSYQNFLLVLSDEGFKVIDRDRLKSADKYTDITKLCENIDDVCHRLSSKSINNQKKPINLDDDEEFWKDLK